MDKTNTVNLTCIQCPLGCPITVTMQEGEILKIEGFTCKRGEGYARKEVTAPARTVTSTVRVIGGIHPVVPVKTSAEIPKGKIFECMKEINKITVTAPVKIGDVVIQNVCSTGSDIVVTADMNKA
jgi:CxxC motif-containing protein